MRWMLEAGGRLPASWADGGTLGALHGNDMSESGWRFTTNNAAAALMDN